MQVLPEIARPNNVSVITGHFQEDSGYRVLRPGGTDDFLLMLTLRGQGRVSYESGSVVCKAGDLTLIRPGMPHDYGTDRTTAQAEWEFIWAHFVPRLHQLAYLDAWQESGPGLVSLPLSKDGADVFPQVRAAVQEMHRRATSGLPRRIDFALNSLEEALLWCDSVNPRRQEARLDPRVSHAMEWMRENFREPFTLRQLSDTVGLSPSRLGHLFREQTGQTPQFYLETQRIERAQQLISLSGLTITAIAATVGYENPFYFTLRFKKRMGLSPTEWRQRQRLSKLP